MTENKSYSGGKQKKGNCRGVRGPSHLGGGSEGGEGSVDACLLARRGNAGLRPELLFLTGGMMGEPLEGPLSSDPVTTCSRENPVRGACVLRTPSADKHVCMCAHTHARTLININRGSKKTVRPTKEAGGTEPTMQQRPPPLLKISCPIMFC